jgi:CRP/FNR family transcriptional regulator, cyclic AMP receptor protein
MDGMTRQLESTSAQGAAGSAELPVTDKEKLIRNSVIFSGVAPDILRNVVQVSRTRRICKGAMLFQQGDDGDALYGVVDGLIRICIAGESGKELTLGLMEPGDIFGEIALLDGLPRTADAYAAEDSTLLVIDRAQFVPLLEREGRLATHVIELLCERLRANTERLGEHAFLNLGARLARKLCALSVAHGRREREAIMIDMKLSQTELAQMLGVTREAVNKQLQLWSRQGVLRFDRGYITIANARRLEEFQHQ